MLFQTAEDFTLALRQCPSTAQEAMNIPYYPHPQAVAHPIGKFDLDETMGSTNYDPSASYYENTYQPEEGWNDDSTLDSSEIPMLPVP